MKWVKASERLPNIGGVFHVKIDGGAGVVMYDKDNGRFWEYDPIGERTITWDINRIEWLDESVPLVAAQSTPVIKWVKEPEKPKKSGMYIYRTKGGVGQAYWDINGSPINEYWEAQNIVEWLDESAPVKADLLDEVMGVFARALEDRDKEIERLSSIIADYDTKETPKKETGEV